MTKRCKWPGEDPLYVKYHDEEWGVPVHDDRKLFEFLVLESAQAGLSWITILRKRENYRKAFAQFDPVKVARFNEKKVQSLLQNAGIIRNEMKIRGFKFHGSTTLYAHMQAVGMVNDHLTSCFCYKRVK